VNIHLNQLRAFVAVVEKKSFSASAKALGISQPAITLQIQSLEAQFGASLIDRRYKNVSLTEAGKILYPAATTVLAKLDGAANEIERLSETISGSLVIGGSTTPGQYLLPKLVGQFRKHYPDVTVRLEIGDTAAVLEMLESGAVNAAIVGAPTKGRKFSISECASDELILIVPPGHRLTRSRGLSLVDLGGEELIFRERGSGTRKMIEAHLKANGISADDLHVAMELGTSEAVVNAVEQGLGVSIVSRWAAEKALRLGTVVEAKLKGLPISRTFYLAIAKRPQTRATEAFLEYLAGADMRRASGRRKS
jgi:DNA-binding transcriptional LysR family regulator